MSKMKPVQTIELPSKNPKWKVILFILLLALGFTAFGYGLFSLLSTEEGWKEIEANSTSEINCSSDFVFMYNLGAGDVSATVENKAITSLYTDATVEAYQLFTNDQGYDGVNNIYYINQHPNEEIVVDEVLYEALTLVQNYQNRTIYLAPIYVTYDDMFYCSDDSEILDFDPYQNEEVAADYREIAALAADSEAIDLQLLGENKVKLHVSEEYLNYASKNYITTFIDFFWMKNAFIVDYLADVMIKNGYTLGSISSYDGFCRNLDDSDTSYSFNIYDKVDQTVYSAAIMQYSGAKSIVYLRNYMMNSLDFQHYYQLENGEVRTSYLDIQDGLCKSAVNNLVCYSEKTGCAETLLNMIPIYISEDFQEDTITKLAASEIYSIYCKDNVIYYNDSLVSFTELFEQEDVRYTTSLIKE